MDPDHISSYIQDHGVVVDDQKKRVKCKHCGKVVSGFSRLKQHLGGIRGDVVPCLEVPLDLKIFMRDSLLEKKNKSLSREVVQLFDSDIPLKENSCAKSTKHNYSQLESTCPTLTEKRKHTTPMAESVPKRCTQSNKFPKRTGMSQNIAMGDKSKMDSMELGQKCIGRFFYENGIDSSVVESPSFQKMINAVTKCGSSGLKIPDHNELEGWVLNDEKEGISNYVKEVKQSWGSTGCSILLDGWTDESGRSLVNFIADCPKGPIYLRSADISVSLGDVNALISLLEGVIEEVGVENVVQVVTYNKSNFMVDVGKQLEEKHRNVFWTVCASCCIFLMIEKIELINPIKEVMSKMKTIVDFIYNHAQLLTRLRMHADGLELGNLSGIRAISPFIALENIVAEEDNLKNIFGSSFWKASTWASTHAGKRVAELVEEPSFWNESKVVLKSIIPLVRTLNLINGGDDRPQMGFLYETLDQAKETISNEFKNKKALYMPYWKIIDDIWNNTLHSPLHAAGYFLNPSLFYSPDFYSDAEVASGILCCLVRMTEKLDTQDLLSFQLDEYRKAKGAFGSAAAIDQRTKLPPAKWWSLYGGHCPELQRFAIRILCQTCTGALKYGLNRSLTEKLHTNGRDSIEQQRLNDLTFFRLNLRLWHSLSAEKIDDNAVSVGEPMDSQVVEEQQLDPADGFIAWMRSDPGFASEEGPSIVQPKDEPV